MLRVWPQPQHRACIAGQHLQGALSSYYGLPGPRDALAVLLPTAKLIDAQIAAAPARVRGCMPRAVPTPRAEQSFSAHHPRPQRIFVETFVKGLTKAARTSM
jgi:hypothetical protein